MSERAVRELVHWGLFVVEMVVAISINAAWLHLTGWAAIAFLVALVIVYNVVFYTTWSRRRL